MLDPKKFDAVTYVDVGMKVYAPLPQGREVLCEVVTACGVQARVVNALHKVDRWFHIGDLGHLKKEVRDGK